MIFDEEFLSTVSYTQSRVPGGITTQPPSHPAVRAGHDVLTTEDPLRFSSNEDAPGHAHSPDNSDTFLTSPDNSTEVPMEEYYTDNLLPALEGEGLNNSSQLTSTTSDSNLSTLRRSKRLQALHQLHYVQCHEYSYPNDLSHLRYCFQVEVEHPESGMNPADFLPTPEGW